MSRRERLQVPYAIRITSASDARCWRECRTPHQRLLGSVPVRIRHVALPEVRVRTTKYENQVSNIAIYLRFGTKRVHANRVYQEYIQDKHHLHMNATRWVTLSEFVKHLGRTGVARVDETEKGWFIAWIDNSPKALAKQVSIQCDRCKKCFSPDVKP